MLLEIFDSAGKLVRRFSSADKIEPINEKELSIPSFWVRQPQPLPTAAGMQRFVWDLHYPPPEGPQSYPISAIYKDTAPRPKGPWVMPGEYSVKFTVGGKTYVQPLKVRMDPRIKTPLKALKQQYDLSMQCYEGAKQARQAQAEFRSIRTQIKTLTERLGKNPIANRLAELDKKITALEGPTVIRSRRRMAPVGAGEPTLGRTVSEMNSLLALLQRADMTPTIQAVTACEQTLRAFKGLMTIWNEIKSKELDALNATLRKAGQVVLSLEETKRTDIS